MSRIRYFRQITESVLRWYVELEDGVVPGASFDTSVLDYRMDVDKILRKLAPQDRSIVLAVHRDGLTHADALGTAGVEVSRPDSYVAQLESRLGELFERKGLADLSAYLSR